MSVLRTCSGSGTDLSLRRISTLSTVSSRRDNRLTKTSDPCMILGLTGKKEGKTRLMNMVMQLRKVTCHPYLFDGAVSLVSASCMRFSHKNPGTRPALHN